MLRGKWEGEGDGDGDGEFLNYRFIIEVRREEGGR